MSLNYKKGAQKNAPLTFDFPSNDDENNNWIKVVRPDGNAMSRLELLQRQRVPDPNNPDNWIPAMPNTEAVARIMAQCILDWSLEDADTGEPLEITEENVLKLDAEDYSFLVGKFSDLFSPKKQVTGTPKGEITVDEKNELRSSSEQGNSQSEGNLRHLTNSRRAKR